ncbi:MAG: PQQ-like beta-propeller repeat protein [Balneolaceae bacterium]|nr:PQQ-like beta-propeller repeat protein [Balneolaceae bacterium]
MKTYRIVPLVFLLQSCFQSPVDPPMENELKIIWDYAHGIVGDAPPVVSGDIVYASGGLYLFALNEDDGSLIWQAEVDDDSELKGQKLLIKGNQIVANHRTSIRGWNKLNGNLIWTYQYDDTIIEPRQNGNHSVTKDGYAFCAFDRKFFTLNMNGEKMLSRQMDKQYGILGITYSNGRLYLGQRNTVTGALTLGRITALDAQTGDSLWVFDTDQGGFSWAAPIVEHGVVYAGTYLGSPSRVFALNAETGEKLWERSGFSTFKIHSSQSKIYVNASGWLYAVNKSDGSIAWQITFEGSSFGNIVYLERYVYHVRSNELVIVDDSTGEIVHREPVPDGTFFWHVAASSDKVFAQTSSQLIAYQPWHLRDE